MGGTWTRRDIRFKQNKSKRSCRRGTKSICAVAKCRQNLKSKQRSLLFLFSLLCHILLKESTRKRTQQENGIACSCRVLWKAKGGRKVCDSRLSSNITTTHGYRTILERRVWRRRRLKKKRPHVQRPRNRKCNVMKKGGRAARGQEEVSARHWP